MEALEVEVEAAQELLASEPRPRLIDCREADEFAICQIAGAELLPMSILAETYRQKLSDPAQPMLIYCHHGQRSLRVTEFLHAHGYANVRSVRGGIDAWAVRIAPGMPRY